MLVFMTLEILCLMVGTITVLISCSILFGESFNEETYGDFESSEAYNLLFLTIGLGMFGFYVSWSFLVSIKMVQITLLGVESTENSINKGNYSNDVSCSNGKEVKQTELI